MLIRYMVKELRNSPRFALLFVLNMSLGLLGFVALDALKRNFDERLQGSARTLLGADFSVSSRRPITANEEKKALETLPQGTKSQLSVSLYTMAAVGDKSSLVDLRTVEDSYPYYGEIVLEKLGTQTNARKLAEAQNLWVAPELAIKLGVKAGDTIKIGQESFTVQDLITDDNASAIGAGMAPRVYMSRNHLQKTGLMAQGNTATHTLLFQLPTGVSLDEQVKKLRSIMPDPSLRIKTYQESGQDNGRMLNYLSDYLGLVALVAFSLAAIGAAYLYRDYFDRRSSSLAILISLGLTHNQALLLYVSQIAFLGFISAAISSLLALGLIPLLGELVKEFTPIAFTPHLPWQTVLVALVMGAFGSILICLPILQRLRHLKPSLLFHEQVDPSQLRGWTIWISYTPVLAAFFALSVWQAHSLKVGSLFFGLSLLFAGILAAIAYAFLTVAKSFRRSSSLPIRISALFLRSHPASTISGFIAIGLGSTLINLIPQLQGSLLKELDSPAGGTLPSFFLFDIQEDQVEDLTQLLASQKVTPQTTSPMIMARLTQVNGAAFLRKEENEENETREEQREQNSRNRGVNLSYRMNLARGESLVEGNFFDKPYTGVGVGEVSLETNYASRLGLKLGDTLTFDVQGLLIEAKVSSFRQVKWNTFEPNFFIVLQPGVIDDAPKTFLMNIPELGIDQKIKTQQEIVRNFPNISVIDVSALIAKVQGIVGQMAVILNVMAYLTTFTGLLVIYSIAQHQALARRWDHNLLKILGAEFPDLMKASVLEFASISAIAGSIGAAIGLIASYIIAKVLFKGVWDAQIAIPFGLTLGLVAVCVGTAWVATAKILRERPQLQIDS
ncbi:MAG: FtsX-like permease family protein [Bdellovibrionota bacterium]